MGIAIIILWISLAAFILTSCYFIITKSINAGTAIILSTLALLMSALYNLGGIIWR